MFCSVFLEGKSIYPSLFAKLLAICGNSVGDFLIEKIIASRQPAICGNSVGDFLIEKIIASRQPAIYGNSVEGNT
jgi:hypothetical protein